MALRSLLTLICGLAASGALASEAAPRPICLSPGETREEIAARHLVEPFAALKSAAAAVKAEALSAKLCRSGEEYVYEITLLHHDGKLVHLVMNAATGKIINPRVAREPPPRT